MDIEANYQRILNQMSAGERGLTRFTPEELEELDQLLLKKNPEDLEKVLCLIEHSASLYGKFEKNLLQLLNSSLSDNGLIFALNCSRKHIIEARFQKAERLPYEFLEALRKLLFHKNPEIVEWTLRLIEGTGNQGVYFLKEFDKIKPPPWKWFNAHQRAVREIITLLERRWGPHEITRS